MSDLTPSAISAAFAAVGRETPPLDACAQIADVLATGADLDERCAYVEAQIGADYILRTYLPAYRDALREATDPARWAARLLTEAAEKDHWALNADKEAAYRADCAARWAGRGDAETASTYAGRAESERQFAADCREMAAERRAKAAELTQKAAA